jgi:hypothetical protein
MYEALIQMQRLYQRSARIEAAAEAKVLEAGKLTSFGKVSFAAVRITVQAQ